MANHSMNCEASSPLIEQQSDPAIKPQESPSSDESTDSVGEEETSMNDSIYISRPKRKMSEDTNPTRRQFQEWAREFRRSDPRYQILNFFNDVAQDDKRSLSQRGFNTAASLALIRAFYKSNVFSVWRPTSFDAIRKMMLEEGVGKGLDIKGKSAKRGKLSGFVPFLQIHQEGHKKEIRTLPKDGKIRVFYHDKEDRERVVTFLEGVAKEMVDTVQKARAIVEDDSIEDDETNEWALSKLIWDMGDSSVHLIDNYAPTVFGIVVSERLFWEGLVVRQDIHREPKSPDDIGRVSEPNFQNMNFAALRPHGKDDDEKPPPRQAVILQYKDIDGNIQDPLDPRNLLMAYEEGNRVMPVVSDFDCFLLGTRGVQYDEPLPDDQIEVSKWCVDQIESILEATSSSDDPSNNKSWTSNWLEVLKNAASSGFYPTIPPLGFSDPKSHNIMKNAIHQLRKEGSVRHGAECFNYYFPQELDDEFLVISDRLTGTSLPWKYVDQEGLKEILMEKIDQGYTFPINPKWVLCDPGWKDVLDKLVASKADHVQDSLNMWYPPQSGLLEKIEGISKRFPNGFTRGAENQNEGTAAMDLAELELKYFMTLQRAKRKLRGYLVWRRLLMDRRSAVRLEARALEAAAADHNGNDLKNHDGPPTEQGGSLSSDGSIVAGDCSSRDDIAEPAAGDVKSNQPSKQKKNKFLRGVGKMMGRLKAVRKFRGKSRTKIFSRGSQDETFDQEDEVFSC